MGDHCRVKKTATKTAELNAILARSDYAAAALRQTRAQLEDVENRLRHEQETLQDQQRLLATLTQDHHSIEALSMQYDFILTCQRQLSTERGSRERWGITHACA